MFVVKYLTYPHELDESIVYPRTMRKEETATGTQIVEEEQFLILPLKSARYQKLTRRTYFANLPMIPPGSLREEDLVLS
jgi:hypothetical protein